MFLFEAARGFAAILLALAVAVIFIALCTDDVGGALEQMLLRPLFAKNGTFNANSLWVVLSRMIPTIFTGLAVCVMFSANQFNLAAEGGVMLGGFLATLVGIYVPMAAGLHLVVCLLVGAVAAALTMLLPALLKVKLGASEMVSSLMLNYIIMYVVLHFLNNNFADRSKGSTQTFPFLQTAAVPDLVPNTDLTWGFVIALVFVALVAVFLFRTRWGYAIRMIGINQAFSKYSGMKVGTIIVVSQLLGGFLAGVGGGIEMLGRYKTFSWSSLPGYGWTGITIAILAGNNPWFVPPAAFFMAYLSKGCNLMATYAKVPAQLIDIIQGVIFLFFAAEQFLSKYRQKLVVKSAEEEIARKKAMDEAKEGGHANA